MTWKLWLDDDLNNSNCQERWAPEGFVGASNSIEAIELVQKLGPPEFMDLDFDLGIVNGEKDTAEYFLKWLAENYFQSPPAYNIHSRNNQGFPWIVSWMESWNKALTFEYK